MRHHFFMASRAYRRNSSESSCRPFFEILSDIFINDQRCVRRSLLNPYHKDSLLSKKACVTGIWYCVLYSLKNKHVTLVYW